MSLATVIADSTQTLTSVFDSAAGGVEVDFAAGPIVIQIVLFVALWILLRPTLFEPMIKLFEEREKRIEGAKLQARKTDEASAGALAKYESEMSKARVAANSERDKLRTEGVVAENAILGKVRASTAQSLEQGRARMNEELASARARLKADVNALAKDLAGRALGREVH
jgi:F-type H+-transporting ATPase subunit b